MSLFRTMVLLLTSLLGGCSALAPVNWLVPENGYKTLTDLPYGDLPRLRLDGARGGRVPQPQQDVRCLRKDGPPQGQVPPGTVSGAAGAARDDGKREASAR